MSWKHTRVKIQASKEAATLKFGDYRAYLRTELEKRQKLSPHYSMRDFAKHIGISPSQLSRVLRNQRGLSKKSAAKSSRSMGISGVLAQRFIRQVSAQSGRSNQERHLAISALKKPLLLKAKAEQRAFCEERLNWSEQVKHFDRFNGGTNLKARKYLFHRARACGLSPEHFPN